MQKSQNFFKSLFLNNRNSFSTFLSKTQVKGNLYTWGRQGCGTGQSLNSKKDDFLTPLQLQQFQNNVVSVSMGPYHSAVITSEGDLYTFGYGKYGVLGNENPKNIYEPIKNSFFEQKGLKVTQVSCSTYNTIAVTDDGSLWTWGWGGNKYFETVGSLGQSSQDIQTTPTKVEKMENVQFLASGQQFATVSLKNGDVYNFGKGDYGSFGDPQSENVLEPKLNENFQAMIQNQELKIVKIKAAYLHQLVLLSDGNLYAMGKNSDGQCGTRPNVLVKSDLILYSPTKVMDEHFKGQKIIDFDVGENSLIILTDQNKVYYSGLKAVYSPLQLQLPEHEKIKYVSCGKDALFAVSENNIIYTNVDDSIAPNTYKFEKDVYQTSDNLFNGGNILEIGGSYNTFYAIVQNN